jgi:hypothetical protein
VLCAVIADTPFYRKILFLKVDILPSQPAYFADSKTSIIGYLYWQNRRGIFLFKISDKFLIIFMGNRLRVTVPYLPLPFVSA